MLSLLELIGLLSVTFIFYLFVNFTWRLLYTTRIGSMLGKSIKMKDMGEWAVVTGATDGIGKAYAEECARHGINTVLISRSLNKLQNVALEIESRYDVKTKTIDVDFTNGPEIFEKIAKNIEGLDIGILINNVGMSYSYPEFLDQVEDSVGFAMRLVNCNCISVVRMSIMVLPQMVQKRKGLII
ncbi:very-long-chain 3-oxoacyl-CoA reductase-B-like, partial [Artemia franciscana]